MASTLKILVCGDVCGKFDQLFNRITSIQKKAGNFEILFCVGDFFGDSTTKSSWLKYKNREVKVPISTFILGPNADEHTEYFKDVEDGGDLCENITYLGKKGVYTSANGLTVAYISGSDGTTGNVSDTLCSFTDDDIDSLQQGLTNDSKFKGVDILLSSCWAKGIEKYGSVPEGLNSSEVGSAAMSQLAIALKPRYHFCGLQGVHYERQPYRNHKVIQESSRHVTRYIGLAKVGNPTKKKFLYAFNITPLKLMEQTELTKVPDDATECPYKLETLLRRQKLPKDEKSDQFFFDADSLQKGMKRKRDKQGGGGTQKKHQPKPQGPCWFCLGSPEVEKHLVVSVGEQCYLALAKGGLTPQHVLITPIGHHQSTCSAPDDVNQEIEKYKAAIRKCLKTQGKAVIFFERNYKSQHLQIQVVAIPLDLAEEVKETFEGCALSQNIELHEIPTHSDLKQIVPSGAPYFYAELPTGEKLLYRITKGFPLQFGREAVAHSSLLDMPHKVDWRNCKYSKQEEVTMTTAFRELFEPFDFNLAD